MDEGEGRRTPEWISLGGPSTHMYIQHAHLKHSLATKTARSFLEDHTLREPEPSSPVAMSE